MSGRCSPRPGGYGQALRDPEGHGLASLLYLLMRDHLTPGILEGLVVGLEQGREQASDGAVFSNDFLAAYALELADRIDGVPPAQALDEAHERIREAQRSEVGLGMGREESAAEVDPETDSV